VCFSSSVTIAFWSVGVSDGARRMVASFGSFSKTLARASIDLAVGSRAEDFAAAVYCWVEWLALFLAFQFNIGTVVSMNCSTKHIHQPQLSKLNRIEINVPKHWRMCHRFHRERLVVSRPPMKLELRMSSQRREEQLNSNGLLVVQPEPLVDRPTCF
jgi:hypothetical protein